MLKTAVNMAIIALGLIVACGEPTIGPSSTNQPASSNAPQNTNTEDTAMAKGKALFTSKSCLSCHNTSSVAGAGPGLGGIFGTQAKLADGTSVKVDEAYLSSSISDPNLQIVQGFSAGQMPKSSLTADEVAALVAYIKSLTP